MQQAEDKYRNWGNKEVEIVLQRNQIEAVKKNCHANQKRI